MRVEIMTVTPYRRRVGSARPSHLTFTDGVGGLLELPNFSVLVRGLDEWNYSRMPERPVIPEPRLLSAVRSELGPGIRELRAEPWLEGQSEDPNGPAGQVGVPVIPFPAWFRCTRCNQLQSLESGAFSFTNLVASRPRAQQAAQELHPQRSLCGASPLPGGLSQGHLDEFPYAWFVHKGGACPHATYPALTMIDQGRQQAADVTLRCTSCGESRNMINAQGELGMQNLPACRGRHPHLGTFTECDEPSRLLILGASNQWFGKTLNVLSVPPSRAGELTATVARLWDQLSAGHLPRGLGLHVWLSVLRRAREVADRGDLGRDPGEAGPAASWRGTSVAGPTPGPNGTCLPRPPRVRRWRTSLSVRRWCPTARPA